MPDRPRPGWLARHHSRRHSEAMHEELMTLLAARHGHFRMESGYHSEQWFDLDRLFADPERIRPFVAELAKRLATHHIDAVCGPMIGGAQLGEMIARELSIECLIAERIESPTSAAELFPVKYLLPSALRSRARDKAVAIVDDAISAGSAVRGAYADLIACGARPVAIGALVVFGANLGPFAAEKKLALESIAHAAFKIWSPTACPLCQRGVPLERVSDAV